MPDFHRLEAPPADYDLGADPGPLPATYDYINNSPSAATGTAASERAQASTGPKPSGFNSGTYFLAWRDPAISANVNRLAKALAENDDYLDKLFRRRMAEVTKTSVVLAGAGFFELPGVKVYTGTDPAAPANTLVQFLTAGATADEEVFIASSMSYIRATDIQPAGGGASVVGSGWVTSPRIVLSGSATGTFQVYYLKQASLARIGPGALSYYQRRDAAGYELQQIILKMVGNANVGGTTYKSTPDTSLRHLAHSGLDERYRKATVSSSGAGAGTAGNLDTPGSGAVILRDGQAPTSYSGLSGGNKRKYVDPINAQWRSEVHDQGGTLPSRANTGLGSSGFVAYGNRWSTRGQRNFAPSLATFLSLHPSLETASPVSAGLYKKYTHIPPTTGSIVRLGASNDFYVLTLNGTGVYPDPYFWVDVGGAVHKTSVVVKRDFIELGFAGGTPPTRMFQIVALYDTGGGTDNRKAVICPVDTGNDNEIPGGTTAVDCRLVRAQWSVGQASPASKIAFDIPTFPAPVSDTDFSLDGMYLAYPPLETTDQTSGTDEFYNPKLNNPLLELMGDHDRRKLVSLREYQYNPLLSTPSTEQGYLTARGTLSIRKVVPHAVGQDNISGGADPQAYTANFTDNDRVILEVDVSRAISNLVLELGAFGLPKGGEIQLFVRHNSGSGGYLTGPTQWGTSLDGVVTYGTVFFANAADAFLKGMTGWVDWYRFVNIGTTGSPTLIATLTRVGGGAL